MSSTEWFQRAPEPAVDLTAGWSVTPSMTADLTRLRHDLATLVQRSRPVADKTELDELLLVFEELASNGLRHGRPPVQVVVVAIPTGWLLDVSDAAAESPPVPSHHRDPATGGMGLSLVAVLSAAHGWIVDGGRKHIWARLAAGSPAPGSGSTVIPAPRAPA